jgi:cell division protein FtsN
MAKQSKKQTGGTLTGIIIGLVIGLLIAVGVAMTIKNTPLPFINKLGKQEKLSEPPAGQVSDPNKPLYGNKTPAKEAARDFIKKAEEKAAENQPEVQKEEDKTDLAKKDDIKKPEPKPAAKTVKTDDKPPVVDKSTVEKPGADKSQKADNTDEKFTYYLQAGAFLEQADAENTKAKLALMGFAANIGERQSDNGTLYRVRIGPFGQLEAMNRIRSKLTGNGVDVAVIRVPK